MSRDREEGDFIVTCLLTPVHVDLSYILLSFVVTELKKWKIKLLKAVIKPTLLDEI